MARAWNRHDFNALYERFICQDEMSFGGRAFYVRYRSRYRECIERLAALAPAEPVDVLDIGGGQLSLMCAKLWNDRGAVADLPGPHLTYMESHGLRAVRWNLCKCDPPFDEKFDFVFFSEVIEHLPIPGYVALERIRKVLRPGGVILCTTPNLYRLRNVIYMAVGRQIFDYFRYPDDETSLGHVLEYSRDHLEWQMKRVGFTECRVEYRQMHHLPTNPLLRPLAWLGYPLHLIPRWRDNLVATGRAPSEGNGAPSGGAPEC